MQRLLIFIFTILVINQTSIGQQILGGDITWECVKQGTQKGKYILTMNLYNRCAAGALPTTAQVVQIQNANIPSAPMIFLGEEDINPPCYDTTQEISCANNSINAVSKGVYKSVPLSLMGTPPAAGWIFTYVACCRPTTQNIQGNPGYMLKSVMYSDTIIGSLVCVDDAPKFIDHPTPQLCLGYDQLLTSRAYDADHDKVIHAWTTPLDSSGSGISWKTGFNNLNQFPSTYHSTINVQANLAVHNGDIRFRSYVPAGYYNYSTKVSSYRDNKLVSEVYKESFLELKSCPPTSTIPPLSNVPPSVTFKDSATASYGRTLPLSDTIFAGDSVSLHITSSDVQFLPGFVAQTNYLIARSGQFGNQFSDRWNGCSDPPCATMDTSKLFFNASTKQWEGQFGVSTEFKWVTDSSQGSPDGDAYHFHFYFRDNWCPTPGIVEYTYTVVVIRPDNYISGQVYKDLNNDGNKGSAEPAFPNVMIKQQPNDYYYNSANDGSYFLGANTNVNYQVNAVPPKYHAVSQPSSGSYSVSSTGYGNNYSAKDFGLYPIPGINDLVIDITSLGQTRPGWNKFYYLNYKNIGTSTLSGQVHAHWDTSQMKIGAFTTPSPSIVSGQTYTWNFSNLAPQENRLIKVYVKMDTSVSIGDSVWLNARIDPISGDTVTMDNLDSILNVATLSWDPNLKAISPDRDLEIQEIKNENYLEYTVHFQNTGTDTAFDVRVVDLIRPEINIESIEMLGSSHSNYYEIRGRELSFFFEDINLPDSGTNFEASMGFVKFRAIADTSLQIGDSVHNEIGIYFDFNDPVLANVTSHIVEEIVDTTTDTNNTSIDLKHYLNSLIEVYPNPASDEVTLRIKTVKNAWMKIELMDINGIIQSQAKLFTGGQVIQKKFNISVLPKGLYFVRVSSGEISVVKKLVIH